MGVAGSGKSTVGRLLAGELGWDYFEADDFHPPENVAKMSRGEPLDDRDRGPWLAAIRARMEACREAGTPGVFTCSALRQAYRQQLLTGLAGVALVHLHGDDETLRRRMLARSDHFMKADLLRSQLDTLEVPADAQTLDVRLPPDRLVAEIRRHWQV